MQMVTQENALRESGNATGPPASRPDEPGEAFFLDMRPGRCSTVQLPLGGGGSTARFDAAVVDAPKVTAASAVQDCSVFIVPQVREQHARSGMKAFGWPQRHGAQCSTSKFTDTMQMQSRVLQDLGASGPHMPCRDLLRR